MAEQHRIDLARRRLLAGLAAAGASATVPVAFSETFLAQPAEARGSGIAEIVPDLNRIHKWDNSNGDTWDPFWADDDNLYAFNCDGRGFGAHGMNLAFNRLAGSDPDGLVGTQVNAMEEYGKGGQKGPDNATWKACGQECIDGVLYAFVSRNTYGSDSGDPLTRQLAHNASLIRSTDRGRTWSRSAQENYDHPMWPDAPFGAPFFVHYGRNGGQVARDGATEYVYACSTNGFWNDGDSLVLGRVRRADLPALKSADWKYFTGGDGSSGRSWTRSVEDAAPILNRPAKCGQTPITWVADAGVYLLVSWYNTERMTKWFEPNEMRYDFYQAPHPWGPWTAVSSFNDRFLGPRFHMYGPSLCARFQERRGADVEVSLFTAGCPFDDVADGPYKMWRIPLLLRTSPLSQSSFVAAADAQVRYHGLWFPWTTTEDAAEDHLPRATQTKGSSAEFSFTGTGIEVVANKSSEQGSVEVLLDGTQRETVSLSVEDFPALLGINVFSRQNLPRGKHVVKVVSADDARINVAGFRVYA